MIDTCDPIWLLIKHIECALFTDFITFSTGDPSSKISIDPEGMPLTRIP